MNINCFAGLTATEDVSSLFQFYFSLLGGWEGQGTFKLTFNSGGAIEFGQLMFKAASSGKGSSEPAVSHGWLSL